MEKVLCACGCGRITPIGKSTVPKLGLIKGQHLKFLPGHGHKAGAMTRVPAEVFWGNLAKGEPSECWEWKGAKGTGGYGIFSANGKAYRAHRFSYELHVGPIPKGMYICHQCDNPCCCNPAHLFAGTPTDNNRDRSRKGRNNRPRKY